jgi:hypothetical protein
MINTLNTELNPICHLLILLGDLTFMGPCILSIFQYISNKMQRYAVYYIWKLLYMFQLVPPPIIRSANNYLKHLIYVTPLQLPAAIVAVLLCSIAHSILTGSTE